MNQNIALIYVLICCEMNLHSMRTKIFKIGSNNKYASSIARTFEFSNKLPHYTIYHNPTRPSDWACDDSRSGSFDFRIDRCTSAMDAIFVA